MADYVQKCRKIRQLGCVNQACTRSRVTQPSPHVFLHICTKIYLMIELNKSRIFEIPRVHWILLQNVSLIMGESRGLVNVSVALRIDWFRCRSTIRQCNFVIETEYHHDLVSNIRENWAWICEKSTFWQNLTASGKLTGLTQLRSLTREISMTMVCRQDGHYPNQFNIVFFIMIFALTFAFCSIPCLNF